MLYRRSWEYGQRDGEHRLARSKAMLIPRILSPEHARLINEQGNVVQPRAVCGNPLLIAAALEAVRKWKYEPTYLNGVPVSVSLTLDVTFQLH